MTSVAPPITAAWLTDVLRRSGALRRGSIATVAERVNPAFNSATSHLAVTYAADAAPVLPTRLLLKRNRPEAWAVEAGAREAAFYRMIDARRDELPMLVTCLAAEIDAATGTSFILLEDLSSGHRVALSRDQQLRAGENVPEAIITERVVEALARFHAAWWGHPGLGSGAARIGRWYGDRAGWDGYVTRRRAAWEALITAEADWFPADLRRLYDAALARFPALWERYLAARLAIFDGITLIHGDAYFANFLVPNDPTTGQVYLIDWQSPEAHLGAW